MKRRSSVWETDRSWEGKWVRWRSVQLDGGGGRSRVTPRRHPPRRGGAGGGGETLAWGDEIQKYLFGNLRRSLTIEADNLARYVYCSTQHIFFISSVHLFSNLSLQYHFIFQLQLMDILLHLANMIVTSDICKYIIRIS
ncbi:Os01g0301300 [Oryza sativa Japonica Group]|uniref:Os01g0301300 protein n=2 Tax=Oryza sativa subsp. japonica TaxID=39947 RepID=Q0JNE2_ORYSJ|nr:hypothetical protein EE612_001984 [Oryza sativa]KAF2949786.1 hypothetical protein DAI22_01g138000 [Oryza sativa Japonica Group]BAF04736.1 Os01g0301300 [Oryza sativa Japonica Group]BAS71720.1 Os01g0301300 [Oryza sativa Japonica Group]|eukprot:NP_001042822.1 Os01g0301300 [Oryza sativa Japonica Group]